MLRAALAAWRPPRAGCWLSTLAGGWKQSHHWTPPVPKSFLQGTDPPTALQWLRRRGPPLPNGVLQQLFRQRRVKAFLPASGRVQRASKDLPLPPGACVLIPQDVAASAPGLQQASQHAFQSTQLAGVGEDLRRRVLYRDAELLVLDKPAGLAVQGGRGVPASIDKLAAQELRFGSSHAPRLAHRLDREVSGALVLGRTPDAAAWLSAAFRRPSAAEAPSDAANGAPAAWVRKRYWAVVEAADGLPEAGSIAQPILVKAADGEAAERPALTRFTVRAAAACLAWLELEPVTGRKHQLRVHCAQALASPIVGDGRYGASRPGLQKSPVLQTQDASPLLRALQPRLQLHCRSLQFKRPGRAAWEVTAPMPPHMRALLRSQKWLGPDED